MEKKIISFYECKNLADVTNILNDMEDCGVKISNVKLDIDEETCTIEYEVEDMEKFITQFIETESYNFIN